MTRTLWVTNDFPPRSGGIEQMLAHLVAELPPEDTRVLASPWPGDRQHDARLPYRVDRVHRRPLLPTPGLLRTVRAAAAEHRAEVVVFGSAWPLAELAAHLDVPTLGITHGREAGMARWGLAPAMTRLARGCTAMTVLSDYTAERLEPLLRRWTRVHRLHGGVDVDAFTPEVDGAGVRARHGLGADQPVVVCVSRLVPRKGQDVLVDVWPVVRAAVPDAHLLLVGTGPLERRLRAKVAELGLEQAVTLTGEVAWDELPAHYRAGDVFAMPCRTRLAGTDVEGLGLVYLEAQACGVPVIAGRSGGAPETVRHGETGLVVDGADRAAVAGAVIDLLRRTPEERARMGAAGRAEAVARWSWPVIGTHLREILAATA